MNKKAILLTGLLILMSLFSMSVTMYSEVNEDPVGGGGDGWGTWTPDTLKNTFRSISCPIVVCNGATLTISNTLYSPCGLTLFVREGSHLQINESLLYNINIQGEDGSEVRISPNSRLDIGGIENNTLNLHR